MYTISFVISTSNQATYMLNSTVRTSSTVSEDKRCLYSGLFTGDCDHDGDVDFLWTSDIFTCETAIDIFLRGQTSDKTDAYNTVVKETTESYESACDS